MARGTEALWVAKRDMTLAGVKVYKGQLVKPPGGVNDHILFGDNTRWTSRFDGRAADAQRCGTDGCDCVFVSLGLLDRHRQLVHAPEWEYRERQKREAAESLARSEARGDTIGGHEIVERKSGPGGPVPYIEAPALT